MAKLTYARIKLKLKKLNFYSKQSDILQIWKAVTIRSIRNILLSLRFKLTFLQLATSCKPTGVVRPLVLNDRWQAMRSDKFKPSYFCLNIIGETSATRQNRGLNRAGTAINAYFRAYLPFTINATIYRFIGRVTRLHVSNTRWPSSGY